MNVIRRRLSGALNRRINRMYRFLDRRIAKICARSERLSSLYYGIWNTAFSREHRAVLTGKIHFIRHLERPRLTSPVLRRNTHRLEKGIISRPRREVFALDYIEETLNCFTAALSEMDSNVSVAPEELKWTHDVLTKYFEICDKHPKLDRLRTEFQQLPEVKTAPPPNRALQRIPYARNPVSHLSISYDDLLQLARRRRSVRWFLQKPVPRDIITKAVEVAAESPSACNRQPFEFRVFDDPTILKEVANLPAGTVGFSHNFPCVIVVIGHLNNFFDERDRHLIYIDASLATMGLVYALECQGVASCCINWADMAERGAAASRTLNLEVDERPIMFIAVGYPDPSGQVPYSQKTPVNQLLRFNFDRMTDS